MKGRQIVLDHFGELEAAALMVDGQLEDLYLDHDAPRPGAIYRAIADRPIKGQGGMFVKTPDGMGFLRQIKGLSPGQSILVQVTGYAEPGKAIPVTAKVLFKSRYAIVTPEAPGINISRSIKDEDLRDTLLGLAKTVMPEGSTMGLIVRSSCVDADMGEIAEDIEAMTDLAAAILEDAEGNDPEKLTEGDGPHALAWREWVEPAQIETESGSFEATGVADTMAELESSQVALGSGASMFIEPTRALTAVDINTGSDMSPAAGLKANLTAAADLPRQCRIRGIGGQITLDLAPMSKKHRRQFENALRAAFRADTVETALVGWTPLGHYELQRKRDRLPYHEALS
ncbi:Ribonuclease E [Roseovarius albus]|uniref:Ribonuclease E n=1 Tax=Roseovarius albus TaxID=1247867 RepID=A0A1X6ZEG1_9RHOB|nr:ribonuclease E/G [Roseovarius albus]SLN49025.1 Ribonuclease E [Roseovarius albus]